MKRISLTLFAVILVITATIKAAAQTEQTRQVSGFHSIHSTASFNVYVKIDGTETLKITADKNVINDIETVVEEGELKIGTKRSFLWSRDMGRVDVYVTAKSLSGLSCSGSGSIKVEGDLQGNAVEVHVSGSGNIVSAVKTDKLQAHVSGSGSMNLSGSSNEADFHISGSGQIKAKALKTGAAKVKLTGSGNAYIDAEKTLSVHITGSGNLAYAGNASVNDIHTSGSGRVHREND